MRRKTASSVLAVALTLMSLTIAAAQSTATKPVKAPEVPYVPTHQDIVSEMLSMARVGPNDVLYDLGSGDGRIVIAAAKQFGTRGVGYDIDPQRVQEANENAKKAGVTDKVRFVQGDIFEADIKDATVVTLYLLPSLNERLRPKLQALKPGTRIVSHAFDMGLLWPPDDRQEVSGKTIYFWTVKDPGSRIRD